MSLNIFDISGKISHKASKLRQSKILGYTYIDIFHMGGNNSKDLISHCYVNLFRRELRKMEKILREMFIQNYFANQRVLRLKEF